MAAEEGNLAVALEESALHVVEVSGDGCREGGMSTSGADTPISEKCPNAEPASVAPDPDPAPGFTVRSGIAFDLDATGPLPDVREDAETLEAARRLREGRLGYRAFKRAFDVAFSACVLVCLSWLFAIIALAVKLDDPRGPVLFRQRRVGRLGRDGEPSTFDMYKFRSMVPDAESRLAELKAMNEKTGPVFKMRDDPRVTRVGRILRKTSLDELPQFMNVLKGDIPLRILKTRPEFSEKSMGAFALPAKSSTNKGKAFSQVVSCFANGLRMRRISKFNCNRIRGMEAQFLAKPVFGAVCA